jgi:RNA polymerase sigma-70 factor (ECF subfamily)
MPQLPGSTTQLQGLLDQAAKGHAPAYDELVNRAAERLLKLTGKMLRNYPHLKRWEQTDDVFQNAVIRLHRSLSEVKPDTVQKFFGLATTQIRRTLIDLARHHFCPEGIGARHVSDGGRSESEAGGHVQQATDRGEAPDCLAAWINFHEAIEALPEEEREVFQLVWYGGMTQREAAEVLEVSERTVIRRMNRARILVNQTMQGQSPLAEDI